MTDKSLKCPNCDSDHVTVKEEQRFMVNTGEHYCYSVKAHDSNAEATCIKCGWVGERRNLND